jgi:hypothetical protein
MTTEENRKRGKFAKAKGRRFEQEWVNTLKGWGLEAKRTAHHQVFGGTSAASDVVCHQNGVELHHELKHRESLPDYLWDYLGNHDALVLRRNGKPVLVVLPVEEYRRLLVGDSDKV